MTAYHEDTPVMVRFPLPGHQDNDRGSWPWLPGTVIAVCGEDEWQVRGRSTGAGPQGWFTRDAPYAAP